MTDQDPIESSPDRYGGDRRAKDRRRNDRRTEGRRAPPPPWRRPSAFVAYGVIAALILVFALGNFDDEEPEGVMEAAAPEAVDPLADRSPIAGPPQAEAFTVAEFERLVAEGEAAVGRVVEAELYCGSISPISLREIESADPRLLAVADSEYRVPGAECRWSRESRSTDFLLVVPPQFAADVASAPEVELNFVNRRRIPANVIWLGRSGALSLRYAGILSEMRTAPN